MAISSSIHDRASILREVIFAADDGVITTFAVVAGSAGASLSPVVVLILGFANLFADGTSMASAAYLGVKSELEFEKKAGEHVDLKGSPLRNGLVTFFSFVISGFLPLLPFVLKTESAFKASAIIVGLSLFGIGVFKGIFTGKDLFKSGLEVFLIGGVAAFVAYAVGYAVDKYVV